MKIDIDDRLTVEETANVKIVTVTLSDGTTFRLSEETHIGNGSKFLDVICETDVTVRIIPFACNHFIVGKD